MVNLSAFVRAHALASPERLAIVYADQRITYADLDDRVCRLSGWLAARGIGAGDVVAALMKNSAAFLELSFAVSRLGAVFLPINYRLAADEVAWIAGNAGARLLLADVELVDSVAGVAAPVQLVDAAAQRDGRALAGRDCPVPPCAFVKPGDLFRLMYTSGTTDRPKGVMHAYSNFYWKSMDLTVGLGLSAADRLLVAGPLYHVGAYDLPGVAVLWLGGTLVVLRDFEPAAALAAIERERLTGAWLAPVMTGMILGHEGRERYDLSSLRWIVAGGERTPEARVQAFQALCPGARYIDAYGLTETCAGDTLMPPGMELAKIGSVGRALAHVEIAIADDHGNWLPPGIDGEICIRGPKVFTGYWNDPAKTAASFFGDWFRSGDIGHLDADGFLYVTDRKKDMILSGGENIAASEVERVIFAMPGVADCAVVGAPDPRWGERPVALVVPKPDADIRYEDLAAFCRARLAGFKVPRELHIRDTLPRNPSGKVLKRVLRDQLAGK